MRWLGACCLSAAFQMSAYPKKDVMARKGAKKGKAFKGKGSGVRAEIVGSAEIEPRCRMAASVAADRAFLLVGQGNCSDLMLYANGPCCGWKRTHAIWNFSTLFLDRVDAGDCFSDGGAEIWCFPAVLAIGQLFSHPALNSNPELARALFAHARGLEETINFDRRVHDFPIGVPSARLYEEEFGAGVRLVASADVTLLQDRDLPRMLSHREGSWENQLVEAPHSVERPLISHNVDRKITSFVQERITCNLKFEHQ